VLVGYVVILSVGGSILAAGQHWLGFATYTLVVSAAFVGVCYAKGEPPRWRWGE
jgi:hypothetical protein